MNTALALENITLRLQAVEIREMCVTEDAIVVRLTDNRTISAPLYWFPRLAAGLPAELATFELTGDGIHWPLLDEDIAVSRLLLGKSTVGESPQSFARWQKWLAARCNGQTTARFAAEFEEQS
jgi:hypothetical protein